MGLLLKLHLRSYVARNTQDFSITAKNCAISVTGDERCHINLFNSIRPSLFSRSPGPGGSEAQMPKTKVNIN